jgi:hypothetical protein
MIMSFLTYITGFFMNFELLPIFTDYAYMLKSPSKSSNLGTLWLKIEQFWPFEEISIFSNTFQNYVRHFRPPTKMATTAELNLT